MKFNIAWLVNSMDISKRSCDGKIWPDFSEIPVDVPDIVGLSVQGSVIHAGIVDTYNKPGGRRV